MTHSSLPWTITGWLLACALVLAWLGGIAELWSDTLRDPGDTRKEQVVAMLLALVWPFAFGILAVTSIKENR